MESEGHYGQDSELGGQRKHKYLAQPQREAGEVFDDSGKEENDREGRGKRQLESDMEELKRVDEKKDENADRDSVQEIDL